MKKFSAVILAACLALATVGCGSNTTAPADTSGEKQGVTETTSDSSKVLYVHNDVEVASMDPQVATDGTSFDVIAAITEGLYSVDADGNPILAMAEGCDKSEDGLTYTFTLRDANWSDGTPVTANDFVFGWHRLVDPAVASEYAFIAGIAGIKNADAIAAGEKSVDELGVTAVDDKTLKVELDHPVSFFESLMSFPSFYPVNEAFFTKCGDTYGTSPETLMSNGPFTVTAYEPAATTITLEKNDTYWDSTNVSLEGLTFQVVKDSQQAMLSYQAGDLDVANLAGEQAEQFVNDPEFHSIMAGYLWYISPNLQVPELNNLNMRKALALSYDKAAVVNNILKDGSIVADFAVPTLLATGPDGKDFREGAPTYLSTNKEEALKCWEAAKAELGVETVDFSLIVEDTEAAQNVAQFIQAEIQSTLPGVIINIETMPKKNRVERLQNGEFELGLTRWGPDYADPMTYLDMWTTNNSNNYGFWSNAEYDAIIDSANNGELALDITKRWEALKEAEAMVMEDVVILPIYQKGNAEMIKSNVSGIEFHSVGVPRIFKNVTKN